MNLIDTKYYTEPDMHMVSVSIIHCIFQTQLVTFTIINTETS